MSTQKTTGGEPTFQVDSPEQYNQIPNDTYFKDNFLGIKLYKTSSGLIVNPWVSNASRVYKALLTQSSTNAPTIVSNGSGVNTPLINTLSGDIVWTRNATGDYIGTLAGAFTDETKILLSLNLNQEGDFDYSIQVASANTIQITTTDGGFSSDDVLNNAALSIEVYP